MNSTLQFSISILSDLYRVYPQNGELLFNETVDVFLASYTTIPIPYLTITNNNPNTINCYTDYVLLIRLIPYTYSSDDIDYEYLNCDSNHVRIKQPKFKPDFALKDVISLPESVIIPCSIFPNYYR